MSGVERGSPGGFVVEMLQLDRIRDEAFMERRDRVHLHPPTGHETITGNTDGFHSSIEPLHSAYFGTKWTREWEAQRLPGHANLLGMPCCMRYSFGPDSVPDLLALP